MKRLAAAAEDDQRGWCDPACVFWAELPVDEADVNLESGPRIGQRLFE